MKGSCPKHGDKYMKQEGTANYCAYPTPGERFSHCFYHPSIGKKNQTIEEKSQAKPDVYKFIFGSEELKVRKKREPRKCISAERRNKSALMRMNKEMALIYRSEVASS